MELIFSLMSGGFGVGTIATLIVGACIGWCVPQPKWAAGITKMVCDKLNLHRFHKEGHAHSDECDNGEEVDIDLGHDDHEDDHKHS